MPCYPSPILRYGAVDTAALGPTTNMNLFTAINAAMRTALETDDSAVIFGEV